MTFHRNARQRPCETGRRRRRGRDWDRHLCVAAFPVVSGSVFFSSSPAGAALTLSNRGEKKNDGRCRIFLLFTSSGRFFSLSVDLCVCVCGLCLHPSRHCGNPPVDESRTWAKVVRYYGRNTCPVPSRCLRTTSAERSELSASLFV